MASATMSFYKMLTLPQSLVADSMYLVLNGNYVETYMTSQTGVAKMVGNSQMISEIANKLITDALNSQAAAATQVQIVADIAARNALTKKDGLEVLVLDATGDTSVKSGAATYVYRSSNTTWYKISEAESMDVVLQWDAIQGKPSATAAQIDDSVSKAHTHANMAVLNDLGSDSQGLLYKGAPVGPRLTDSNW